MRVFGHDLQSLLTRFQGLLGLLSRGDVGDADKRQLLSAGFADEGTVVAQHPMPLRTEASDTDLKITDALFSEDARQRPFIRGEDGAVQG